MINKGKIGPRVFWGISLLVILLWLTAYPETTVKHSAKGFFIYSSQITALLGFALFAVTFMLAARIKWLEPYFGGLDKMYHSHHQMAKVAFVLLLLHPILLAGRWIPEDMPKALWYIFPVHRRSAIDFGSWALWGLIILMALTLVIKLPYDKWKLSHKFMGVVFIVGVIHLFSLDNLAMASPVLFVYLLLISMTAIAAWIYKSFLLEHVLQKHKFKVANVDRVSEYVMEITLESDRAAKFLPGQFFFFTFIASGITRESHPYTVCSKPDQNTIKIMVKALGDYTRDLFDNLDTGASALLEGPYGRFDFKHEINDQVWIAGGVGIAPFLSWVRNLKGQTSDFHIDLYYCVNTMKEAVYLDEFKEFEKLSTGFTIHLVCADKEGFLNAGDIPDLVEKAVFICGPKEMRQKLLRECKSKNVPKEKIHFEDFDFI